MADDHHVVEPFFVALLKSTGFLSDDASWSMLDQADPAPFFEALADCSFQTVMEVASKIGGREADVKSFTKLVTNYIEFYNYTQNNGLTCFSFNNQD